MIKILQLPSEKINNFLTHQIVDCNTEYIDSIYLVKIYDYNDLIIENMLTGEIIVQTFPTCVEDNDFLIKHWFKVPKNFDIYSLYKNIQNQLNVSQKNFNNYSLLSNFSKAIIFSTLGCNANCYYCYEKKFRNEHYQMTEEVADDFIKLLIKNQVSSIKISWFGGEPMFNEKIIDYLYEQLQKNNIDYSSFMITNGLLFNKEKILKAKNKWNLKSLQITIDGIEEDYEKIKQVPRGSFNLLINNIRYFLKEKINVHIRLNLGKDNYYSLRKLIKILADNFSKDNRFSISVHELFGDEFEVNTYPNLKKLNLYIESFFNNFQWRNLHWKEYGCMADGDTTITILPDGKVGLCEHNAFYDYYSDLKRSFYNINIVNKYAAYSDREECQLCTLRPGCIYNNNCPADGGNNCNFNRVQFLLFSKKKNLIKIAKKQRKRRKHLMITKELYTNLDIYNKATALVEAFNTKDGSDLNYPVKVNFYLQKNLNAFLKAAQEIEQKRMEIIQKYGKPTEEDPNNYKIDDDKIEEATKEIQDFLELEQEIPVSMLKLDWFDKIDMTAAQVAAISFMIEEEE